MDSSIQTYQFCLLLYDADMQNFLYIHALTGSYTSLEKSMELVTEMPHNNVLHLLVYLIMLSVFFALVPLICFQ